MEADKNDICNHPKWNETNTIELAYNPGASASNPASDGYKDILVQSCAICGWARMVAC